MSSAIEATIDLLIFQAILSSVTSLLGESIASETRVFTSGTLIVCLAAGRLYGFMVLTKPFVAEKSALAKTGVLLVFLNVLFAMTTDYTVPLASMILSLAAFFMVSFALRYSLRHAMDNRLFPFSALDSTDHEQKNISHIEEAH